MHIRSLRISDLRVIEQLELEPVPGLNLIVGANGAGKTSVLEAIYLAGRGRTFRHVDAGPMVREGASGTTVLIRFSEEGREETHTLGVRRERRVLTCRLDGRDVTRRSTLAEALPVQWIGSQPQLLLGLGPDVRRRFLDMGLFHVEQSYLSVFSEFQRILRQRNSAIRQGSVEVVEAWNRPFEQAATSVNDRRRLFVEDLMGRARQIIAAWGVGFAIDYRFGSGWKQERPLIDHLDARLETDMRMGYTTVGPQRAELELLADGVNAERTLSRGQQKILVLALNLALMDAMIAARGRKPILLIDDLPAELDRRNRERVISEFESRRVQAFLAVIEEGALRPKGKAERMFHVEHGALVKLDDSA